MKFLSRKAYFFLFLILYISSISAFKLSSNNYFPLAHGPYYFSFAESLYNNLGVYSYWTIPQDPKLVYTFQMGVSFIIYLCIFFFNLDFWFLAFYFFSSYLWCLGFFQLEKFLKSIEFAKYEIYFLMLVIFFQPYNINQVATFSNETIYLPLLVLSFFKFINSINKFKKNNFTAPDIFIFLFFIFGIFLRVHHVIFIASVGLYIFFYKKEFIKYYFIIFFFSILVFLTLFFFSPLVNSLTVAKSILFTSLDNFNLTQFYNNFFSTKDLKLEIGMGYIPYNEIFLLSLERFSNIITYPILLSKFTHSIQIKSFFLVIFLILNLIGLKHIKKFSLAYYKFSLIYLCFSILFIYFLPFFELNYVLPISFIFFINLAFVIKFYLRSFFLKILIPSSIFFVFVIFLFYNGVLRNQEIEIYGNRALTKKIKNFYEKFPVNENLFYATPDVYYTFELHYWHAGARVCLTSVSIIDCLKQRKINKYSNVIFFFNKGEEVLKNKIYINFLTRNNFDINDIKSEDFINFYIKKN